MTVLAQIAAIVLGLLIAEALAAVARYLLATHRAQKARRG